MILNFFINELLRNKSFFVIFINKKVKDIHFIITKHKIILFIKGEKNNNFFNKQN